MARRRYAPLSCCVLLRRPPSPLQHAVPLPGARATQHARDGAVAQPELTVRRAQVHPPLPHRLHDPVAPPPHPVHDAAAPPPHGLHEAVATAPRGVCEAVAARQHRAARSSPAPHHHAAAEAVVRAPEDAMRSGCRGCESGAQAQGGRGEHGLMVERPGPRRRSTCDPSARSKQPRQGWRRNWRRRPLRLCRLLCLRLYLRLCLRLYLRYQGELFGLWVIVIPVENHPQKRSFRLADYPPSGWGMLISGHNIFTYHIYAYRRVKSGRHDTPHIRKSSLDHDSGEKNRGCKSYF